MTSPVPLTIAEVFRASVTLHAPASATPWSSRARGGDRSTRTSLGAARSRRRPPAGSRRLQDVGHAARLGHWDNGLLHSRASTPSTACRSTSASDCCLAPDVDARGADVVGRATPPEFAGGGGVMMRTRAATGARRGLALRRRQRRPRDGGGQGDRRCGLRGSGPGSDPVHRTPARQRRRPHHDGQITSGAHAIASRRAERRRRALDVPTPAAAAGQDRQRLAQGGALAARLVGRDCVAGYVATTARASIPALRHRDADADRRSTHRCGVTPGRYARDQGWREIQQAAPRRSSRLCGDRRGAAGEAGLSAIWPLAANPSA